MTDPIHDATVKDLRENYDSYEVTGCDGGKYLERRRKGDSPPVQSGPYARTYRKITERESKEISAAYMAQRKAITSMKDHFCDTMAARRHPA